MTATKPDFSADFGDDHQSISRLCLSYADGTERAIFFKPDGSVDLDASSLTSAEYKKIKKDIDASKSEAMRSGEQYTDGLHGPSVKIPTTGTAGDSNEKWDAAFDKTSKDKLAWVSAMDSESGGQFWKNYNKDGTVSYQTRDASGFIVDVDKVPHNAQLALDQAERAAKARGRPSEEKIYNNPGWVYKDNALSGVFLNSPGQDVGADNSNVPSNDNHAGRRSHAHRHVMGPENANGEMTGSKSPKQSNGQSQTDLSLAAMSRPMNTGQDYSRMSVSHNPSPPSLGM